jgi:hypothetical protein
MPIDWNIRIFTIIRKRAVVPVLGRRTNGRFQFGHLLFSVLPVTLKIKESLNLILAF